MVTLDSLYHAMEKNDRKPYYKIPFHKSTSKKGKAQNVEKHHTKSTWENCSWCPKSSNKMAEVSGEFNLEIEILDTVRNKFLQS